MTVPIGGLRSKAIAGMGPPSLVYEVLASDNVFRTGTGPLGRSNKIDIGKILNQSREILGAGLIELDLEIEVQFTQAAGGAPVPRAYGVTELVRQLKLELAGEPIHNRPEDIGNGAVIDFYHYVHEEDLPERQDAVGVGVQTSRGVYPLILSGTGLYAELAGISPFLFDWKDAIASGKDGVLMLAMRQIPGVGADQAVLNSDLRELLFMAGTATGNLTLTSITMVIKAHTVDPVDQIPGAGYVVSWDQTHETFTNVNTEAKPRTLELGGADAAGKQGDAIFLQHDLATQSPTIDSTNPVTIVKSYVLGAQRLCEHAASLAWARFQQTLGRLNRWCCPNSGTARPWPEHSQANRKLTPAPSQFGDLNSTRHVSKAVLTIDNSAAMTITTETARAAQIR